MPTIEDLRKSITEMSDEELDEVLNASRNNRATPASKQEEEEEEEDELPDDLSDVDIDDLTPEEAQKLLNKLG